MTSKCKENQQLKHERQKSLANPKQSLLVWWGIAQTIWGVLEKLENIEEPEETWSRAADLPRLF